MTIKERLRRDRREMAAMNRNEKLVFLWDYYKIPILSALFVLLVVIVTVTTSAGSGKAAMYAVFVNAASADGDQEAMNAILSECGVDMTGRHVDITANLTLGKEHDEMGDAQTIQVLAALFGINGLDFFAADEEVFARYAAQNAFLDLALFIDAQTLELHSGDLYYYENANGQTVLGGIRLSADSPIHAAGYYYTDIVVGVAANAQNMEEAVSFLKQLL